MALSNLFGWNKKVEAAPAAACGTACGAGDKLEEKPTACGSAAAPATSLPRPPLLAALPTSRKKSPLPVALPAAPAISNPFYPHKARSRQATSCREYTKCYSVYPVYI